MHSVGGLLNRPILTDLLKNFLGSVKFVPFQEPVLKLPLSSGLATLPRCCRPYECSSQRRKESQGYHVTLESVAVVRGGACRDLLGRVSGAIAPRLTSSAANHAAGCNDIMLPSGADVSQTARPAHSSPLLASHQVGREYRSQFRLGHYKDKHDRLLLA